MNNPALIVILVIAALFVVIVMFVIGNFISLYVQALLSNAHVALLDIIGMRLRKVDIRTIVVSRIRAIKAGMDIPTNALETHYLAGGRVPNVISAIVAAKGAKIELPWSIATAIDLAGRDILDAVQTSVNPKVIDCPAQGGPRTTIDAVAKDGIQLKAKARVTVRTNIKQLVGGATEETIIARVGQGIVSAIGSSPSYKHVLENPDRISKVVLGAGLDSQTAFEIVSIDIADVSVAGMQGRDVANVGALLEAERAETDKKMRQAEAEGRRAMAVALEQEMRAQTQENRAKVTLAEAEVPKALAEALRNGRMGVMDYYGMKNVIADTDMRHSISGKDAGQDKPTKEV